MTEAERITKALKIAEYGGFDGGHHKMWVIDQMIRALTDCPTVTKSATDAEGAPYTYEAQGESEAYRQWIQDYEAGEEGPHTYEWDEGIAP